MGFNQLHTRVFVPDDLAGGIAGAIVNHQDGCRQERSLHGGQTAVNPWLKVIGDNDDANGRKGPGSFRHGYSWL
jgi:hypothetical protein